MVKFTVGPVDSYNLVLAIFSLFSFTSVAISNSSSCSNNLRLFTRRISNIVSLFHYNPPFHHCDLSTNLQATTLPLRHHLSFRQVSSCKTYQTSLTDPVRSFIQPAFHQILQPHRFPKFTQSRQYCLLWTRRHRLCPTVPPLLRSYGRRKAFPRLGRLYNTMSDTGDAISGSLVNGCKMSSSSCSHSWVREQFVDFFKTRCNHVFWPSSPVVPLHDPSLLFINAGMNQFKPIFLGTVDSTSNMAKLRRAANSQKCIRAGGKHNDLDDVGKDVYHHTFFEMMGNWSFGDYFKVDAIQWSFELLTKVYGIDPDRLYVTYYGGDPKEVNCPPDTEARDIWCGLLPENRVLPFGLKDNFWEMADTGPCGPCSEIHYDRIGNRDASSLVNADDPSVLEIWNLVFMQFNRENDLTLTPLPAKCVDTGMGLERVVSVLAGVDSNYDTDLFVPLFEAIRSAIPGLRPYTGLVGADDVDNIDTAYRVVADHIRTLTVAITDGAEPSNEHRGYVLRRVLRRAVRYGQQTLGAPKSGGWFYKLVDTVVTVLGDAYPELRQKSEKAKDIIKREELQFTVTLDKGVDRFNKIAGKLLQEPSMEGVTRGRVIPGHEAFTLYATFGFPLDLTEIMAREKGMTVDVDGFHAKFEEHQQASEKKSHNKDDVDMRLNVDNINVLGEQLKVPPTNDSFKYDWDSEGGVGPTVLATIKALWNGKCFIDSAGTDIGLLGMVLDKTNFYAEQGGQIYDEGLVACKDSGGEFDVLDTQRFGDFVMHIGKVNCSTIKVGDAVELFVDYQRRCLVAKNHTATHLLNFALRKVVSDSESIDQRGSLVESGRLRFDFSYNGPVNDEDLGKAEDEINSIIHLDAPVVKGELPLADAQRIPGLRAVFGEVYPDPVRVVSVGALTAEQTVSALLKEGGEGGLAHSVEFCGGTHIVRSGEMQQFVIVTEEGIAKGIRRIVALTGPAAKESVEAADDLKWRCDELKKQGTKASEKDVTALKNEIDQRKNGLSMLPLLAKKKLLKSLEELRMMQIKAGKNQSKILMREATRMAQYFADKHEKTLLSGCLVCNASRLESDPKALGEMAQVLRSRLQPSVSLLCYTSTSTAVCGICLPRDGLDATQWLGPVMAVVGGKAGGKPGKAVGSAKIKGGSSDEGWDWSLKGMEEAARSWAEKQGEAIVVDSPNPKGFEDVQ
eukprot:GHVQ01032887.1.p1 GENE.GHVQ01032887.1~~GHVQ01032887.1.p1  ORF type:complete len:1182 (-),score=178.53 GHVQ01032887.1:404-3949(-)